MNWKEKLKKILIVHSRSSMSKIPVTVCIIAKNEEKHIEECLKHLKKYDMEIIVTDTGSTSSSTALLPVSLHPSS